jgi:hypothetical protein
VDVLSLSCVEMVLLVDVLTLVAIEVVLMGGSFAHLEWSEGGAGAVVVLTKVVQRWC